MREAFKGRRFERAQAMESERIESDMKIESKREKWLPFGWYSALFFVFFGVGILFHVINGRSFIYNVDAPGQDYPFACMIFP